MERKVCLGLWATHDVYGQMAQRKIVNMGQAQCVWAMGKSMAIVISYGNTLLHTRIVNFESGEEDSQYGLCTMCMGNGQPSEDSGHFSR